MKGNFSIENYRIIKEFTEGIEYDWTINNIMRIELADEYNG